MLPLAEHVELIRAERGSDRVPDFDPTEAGVLAPVLLLLEAPGGKATRERGGSGFVSPDNDDATAENMWRLLREAGIERSRDVVTWNIVPWYLGSDTKIRQAAQRDLDEARPHLIELLGLLPSLVVAVLIGKRAAYGWRYLRATLPTIEVPHPSPRNLNSRPWSRAAIRTGLATARTLSARARRVPPTP
jgi:hypothetical protein